MALQNNQRQKEFPQEDGSIKTLTITLLPANKGIPLATKLSGVAGKLFGKDVSIMEAVAELAGELDVHGIAKELLQTSLVDSGEGDFPLAGAAFETYFAGNYGELIDFVAFALEANFSSFFASKALATKTLQ